MLTIAQVHLQNLAAARAQAHHLNLATYLSTASFAELAHLTGALAAECAARGCQAAEPLGLVAARLEYCAELAP